ncbi:MAG TPA: hypothetical protein VJ774_02120 [Actinomycetota bacterium]|nr:hypothetical protein [Actinomycetota bacterium]
MIAWVQPKGPQSPKPGTTLHVVLEQIVDGRPLHSVGRATVHENNQVCVRLPEGSEAGRVAEVLLREDCLTAWYWGSAPTLRLRP